MLLLRGVWRLGSRSSSILTLVTPYHSACDAHPGRCVAVTQQKCAASDATNPHYQEAADSTYHAPRLGKVAADAAAVSVLAPWAPPFEEGCVTGSASGSDYMSGCD